MNDLNKVPFHLLTFFIIMKGLEFLKTNQDLAALAEIKSMAISNKEHVEGIKRELAAIARQNKQTFSAAVVTQSPGIDSGVLDSIRERLNELQNDQGKLVLTTDRQYSELLEDLNRKQVKTQRSSITHTFEQ